jgi:mono/diheme cytochrome c family protein
VAVAPWLRGPDVDGAETPTPPPTFAGDPAAVQRGSQVFAANCAACHGATGKGDGPAAAALDPKPIDLTNPIHRSHSDADLANWIANGDYGSAMPAFAGTLTNAEIADVIVFNRSLQAAAGVSGTIDVPRPEECTVTPRRVAGLVPTGTITPQPAPTAQPVVGPDAFPWPQGEPASEDEMAGITATVREFYACYNAGDYERQLALYSDRMVRPQFAALDAAGWQATLDYVASPPAAVAVGERQWVDAISDVRRLPDGRVGAYVAAVDPVNHPHQIDAVLIFARVDGRWVIDEVHADPSGTLGISTTPTPGQTVPVAAPMTPIASGDLILTVRQAPASASGGAFLIELTTATGEPVTNARIELDAEMLDMQMSLQVLTATSQGDGTYIATLPIAMSGAWQVRITVDREGQPPALFVVTFEIP